MSFFTKIIEYFRSAKQELSKVTWPSREQTVRYSTLVIIVSLIVAGFFGMLDSGLSRVVTTALTNRPAYTPVDSTETDPTVTPNTEEKTFEFEDLEITTDGGDVTIDAETQE